MRARGFCQVLVCLLTAVGAHAQVEEIFSRHLQVFRPEGDFPSLLVKLAPPEGTGWREVEVAKAHLRLRVPEDARVDAAVEGNRLLRVTLAGGTEHPQPVLRVDAYTPHKGDPTKVDAEYAADYADQYSQAAFHGKFSVSDRGFVVKDKKVNFALVGGVYTQGAVAVHRVQWAYLDGEEQLFLTFDCADTDWPRYQDSVARALLSVEIGDGKRK